MCKCLLLLSLSKIKSFNYTCLSMSEPNWRLTFLESEFRKLTFHSRVIFNHLPAIRALGGNKVTYHMYHAH